MPQRCELLSGICRRLPLRLRMSPLGLVCRKAVVPALGGLPAAVSPRGLTESGRRRSSGHAARGELTSKGTAPSSVPSRRRRSWGCLSWKDRRRHVHGHGTSALSIRTQCPAGPPGRSRDCSERGSVTGAPLILHKPFPCVHRGDNTVQLCVISRGALRP